MLFKLKKLFLTWFGDIKVFPYPMWIVYCPTTFLARGKETRKAMELVRPGDLILRGYSDYLDGRVIPGKYSHTGVFIGRGKLIHAVAEGVCEVDIIDFLRCDRFCILRPVSGQDKAIARVKEALGKPYDFNFEQVASFKVADSDERMYCHELGAMAYKELGVEKKASRFLKVFKVRPSYLAESFLTNPNFTTVLEFYPKA